MGKKAVGQRTKTVLDIDFKHKKGDKMKEITIKLDLDSIAGYLSEEEIVEIVKSTIEKQINNYYNHDINDLIKSYLFHTIQKHTDNVFMNTPCMKEKIKEHIENCVENLHSYDVFRQEEKNSFWGKRDASPAQKTLDEYCSTEEFKEKLKNKIDSVFEEKIELMDLNDFICMMADGMADIIKNNLIKPKGEQ